MSRVSSARSIANSEPTAVLERKIDSRPVSSYEVRRSIEEVESVDPEIGVQLARKLRIEGDCGVNLQWIVTDCLKSLKSAGWSCSPMVETYPPDLVFTHSSSGEKRSDHEIVDAHRELAVRIIFEHNQIESLRRNPHYRIRELAYQQMIRTRDSRSMVTPVLIDSIFDLLQIEVFSECYLTSIIAEELISAYIRMEDLGGISEVTIETCLDIDWLLTRIGMERARFLKQMSPSRLLFCVECKQCLADGICATCGDCLCACCHSALHRTGNRQDHLFVFIEQCVCSECEKTSADIRCSDCSDLFCRDCFKKTHEKAKRTKHCVQLAIPLQCINCYNAEAHVLCLDCLDVACVWCINRSHRRGPRSNHNLYGIRKGAFSRSLFASNVDAVTIILDKYLKPVPDIYWHLLYDDQLEPYWYNFYTKKLVRTTLKDLETRPETPIDLEDEIRQVTIKRAIQRAVFDVPPIIRMNFKPLLTT